MYKQYRYENDDCYGVDSKMKNLTYITSESNVFLKVKPNYHLTLSRRSTHSEGRAYSGV